MRTTLSLDDDVAGLIERVRKSHDLTFKQVVNDALREGLARLVEPRKIPLFRTRSVDLGRCYYPNLDNIHEILDEAEDNRAGR